MGFSQQLHQFWFFLSNCWLLTWFSTSFSCQTLSLNFFSVIFLGFQNPGFQFPVPNPTRYFIFQVSKFLTQKRLFLVYFNRPTVNHLSPLCVQMFTKRFCAFILKIGRKWKDQPLLNRKVFWIINNIFFLDSLQKVNILNLLQLILWTEPKTEWRKEQRGRNRAVGGQEGHLPPRVSQEWK